MSRNSLPRKTQKCPKGQEANLLIPADYNTSLSLLKIAIEIILFGNHRSFKVVPDLRKSSMNFFLNSVIWSLLLGYSNNEKKEGGPRIGYGDIRRQKGGIF